MSQITIKFSQADWAKPFDALPEPYQQALALRAQGVPWKAVTAETGVGYASGWLAEQRHLMDPSQFIPVDPADPIALLAAVRHARLTERNSWGLIMVRTGLPEGQVSRAFELATNVFRDGLRNGKGGRFLQDNAEAYAATPKIGWVRPTASDVEIPAELGDPKAALVARLEALSVKGLRRIMVGLEIKPQPKAKADMVEAIVAAGFSG